jgi:RNA polymerase sigma-70 factor (ECF subfamily)
VTIRFPRKQRAYEAGQQTSPFEDLVLPLIPSLYNLAFWLSRNAADAEDLVQETFLKALRGFASFEPSATSRHGSFAFSGIPT